MLARWDYFLLRWNSFYNAWFANYCHFNRRYVYPWLYITSIKTNQRVIQFGGWKRFLHTYIHIHKQKNIPETGRKYTSLVIVFHIAHTIHNFAGWGWCAAGWVRHCALRGMTLSLSLCGRKKKNKMKRYALVGFFCECRSRNMKQLLHDWHCSQNRDVNHWRWWWWGWGWR